VKRIQGRTESHLVLEQRVSDTHSAMPAEHQWHVAPHEERVEVTNDSAPTVMEKTAYLLAKAPDRDDIEYRVLLLTTDTHGWVLS
jgi:hypothetical protein